jgi:uncharacterized membrane protein
MDIRKAIKRRFISGLIIVVPVIITISVIVWFFNFIDGLLSPILDSILHQHISGLGFVTAIILVFFIGIISSNVIGKRIIGGLERLLLKLPVFKGIYTALKQLVDAFSPDSKGAFKRFVVVEYPRKGSYAFGFLTKECSIKSEDDGSESCMRAVYIPTNNLYLGEIVLFREDEVIYTDIPIEEGIKIILSGGIAAPQRIVEAKE